MSVESVQIHLNSRYATSYNDSTLSDCNFNLPVVEIESGHTIMLSVNHAVIPYSFYNINKNNNVIYIQEIVVDGNGAQVDTINSTLYIQYGNYNAYQLASHLSTLFVDGRMTVTYNSIQNKFLFVNSTYNFKFLAAYTTAIELLGLSKNDIYNTSALQYYMSNNLVNLATVRCICLATNLQTGCINNNRDNESNILCSIPVDSQPYSVISFKNMSNFKVNLFSNVLSNISIRLVDDCGNPVDLNRQYFSLVLQIDIVKFIE